MRSTQYTPETPSSGSNSSTVRKSRKRSGATSRRPPSEHDDQVAILQWAEASLAVFPDLRWLHSTLNGVRLPIGLAMKAKRAGLKRGPSDLFLDVPRHGFAGMRIELKRAANKEFGVQRGQLSPEQAEWLEHYTKAGFLAVVCWGPQAVIDALTAYLSAEAMAAPWRDIVVPYKDKIDQRQREAQAQAAAIAATAQGA